MHCNLGIRSAHRRAMAFSVGFVVLSAQWWLDAVGRVGVGEVGGTSKKTSGRPRTVSIQPFMVRETYSKPEGKFARASGMW
jgi:hypothetical protein